MKIRRSLIVSVMLICGCGALFAAQTEEAKQASLRGVWQIEGLEIQGAAAKADLKDFKLVFAEQYMTYHMNVGKKHHADFSIELNTSKTPHEIDATILKGAYMGQVCRGIFAIRGDVLEMRLPEKPSEARPTTFKYVAGSSVMGFKARRISR